MKSKKYDLGYYNEYGVLRIPAILVYINLYLLKYYFLALIPALALMPKIKQALDSIMPVVTGFAHTHVTIPLLLSCVPALLVMIAMIKRVPGVVSPKILWMWQNGLWLLLASVILELGFIIGYILMGIRTINGAILLIAYLDLLIIFYLSKSQWVRDIFAEFPKNEIENWEEIRKREELAWEQAKQLDTEQAYQDYLDAPITNKKHAYEARQRRNELSLHLRNDR
ncbi:MAG: hypothetical protein BWK79_11380 [Beggiatoa sp. IS2]|nr:MAG: hypothetical protein BWK79_11380 [Beggiatoa sp. IS2]